MTTKEPLPNESLARAIFTAAAGQAIVTDASGADFEGMAEYAFAAAVAYAKVQQANKPPSVSSMI